MLLALGLSCGDDGDETPTTGMDPTFDPSETATSSCLSCLSPCLSTTGFTTGMTSANPSTSVGPCLDTGDDLATSTGEASTGPCLAPEPPDSSGSSDGGDTDDTGTGGSTGMMDADPADREIVLRRVLERGALPADVAQRLRSELPED